ncbi:CarD family transcriptional regulator [Arcanobacterium haemolyticum]|nr:CarD family transcriptional regulator [Arcanobacterium haemolyticum]
MGFTIGETVVYPHHGAAYIEDVSTKKIRGEEKLYLTLRVMQGDLVIQVPADKVEEVGVRDVSNDSQLEHVFSVLRAQDVEEPANWSRRYKANSEKLTSGDVIKVAEVVRDLTRRDSGRGLSAGEKRMLSQARQILGSEVALARNVSEDEALGILDEILDEMLAAGESSQGAEEKDEAQG